MVMCVRCGVKEAVRKYCPSCKKEVLKEHDKKYNAKRQKTVKDKTYRKKCKECGKSFKTTNENKLTCSDICSYKRKCKFMAYASERLHWSARKIII